ncbi:MAG TPA: DUF3224 domain-containing protein [Actinomycetota bacterium]|nr:DUF3224 domain-containing protein [Actinomycetota bacterium]
MPSARGTFEVLSGGEETIGEPASGVRLTRVTGTQRFTGDLQGTGAVDWLMSYSSEGRARFVGFQRFEGALGGHAGSFVAESVGDHDGTRSTGRWSVIVGTGTGELEGLTGEGAFDAPGGPRVAYSLSYRFA